MKNLYRIKLSNNEYFFSKQSELKYWYNKAEERGLKWLNKFNEPYKENIITSAFHREEAKFFKSIDPYTGKEETIKFSKIIIV